MICVTLSANDKAYFKFSLSSMGQDQEQLKKGDITCIRVNHDSEEYDA